jgi:zinc protease
MSAKAASRSGHVARCGPLRTATLLVGLGLLTGAGCRSEAARSAEMLPGRSRPLLEHTWPHPRDLQFGANRFVPADPRSSLLVTPEGVRAYAIPAADARVVEMIVAVPLGRGLERSNEAGAAELLSRLLSQHVNDRLGSGFIGRVQMDQDVDFTRFSVQSLADDWRAGLAALVDAMRRPRLDAATISAYRTGPGFARPTRGLGGASFRPAVELARMIGGYPLAPPDPGLAVGQEAVRNLAARSLSANSVVFGVAGGVSREDARRELESLTAGWQAAATTTGVPAAAGSSATIDRLRTIDEPGFTTWIAVGHPVPPTAAADEAAVAVMTEILNIRLNITAREIRGLANQVILQMPATPQHGGLLHVRTGARPESVAPLLHYARQELSRIREASGAPTLDELEQVKGGLVLGKWQGSLDGAGDASSTYAVETVRRGSLDRLLNWPDAVRAVTARDVTAAAQTYVHPDKLATVIIGPLDAVRKARHPRWPMTLDEALSPPADRNP